MAKIKVHADFPLLAAVVALIIFGVVMVFSASYYDMISEIDNPFYYLIRVSIWAILGLIVMFIVTFIPYKIYYRLAPVLFVISLVLLLLLFTPLGIDRNGAVRWIALGPITIMPGEIAKILVIFFVAAFMTKFQKYTKSFVKTVVPLTLVAGTYFILIYLQPNLSTAVIVLGIVFGMMFIGGVKVSHLLLLVCGGVVGIAGLVLMDEEGYQFQRITSFLDPFADPKGDSYQVVQALLALGGGGVFGLGLGKSIQKALYLPEAQNDFIFAIIGEELGFIGCLILLIVYLFVIWRGALIAINAPDRFSMLLAGGMTLLLAAQVIMNVAVVTSLMPPTGVILPFVSYGGNAMLQFCLAIGVLLNISKASERKRILKEIDDDSYDAVPLTE